MAARYGKVQFEQMKNLLTEDLWLSSGIPYDYSMDNGRARGPGFFLDGTAILKGVLDLLSHLFSFSRWSNWSIHINPQQSSISTHFIGGIMIIMGNLLEFATSFVAPPQ